VKGGDSRNETMIDKETEVLDGIVTRAQTGVYYVQHNGRVIECSLRGKVKREFQVQDGGKWKNVFTDPVAVGDKVTITVAESEKGAIESVLPRKSKLSRKAPGTYLKLKANQTRIPRRLKSSGAAPGPTPLEQVVVANADQLLIILSTKAPQFSSHLLDRFLIVAEAGELESIICINKMDLLNGTERSKLHQETRVYEDIGYKVIYTSALKREGLDLLVDLMKDRLSALAGPSGTGKSTLLNAIQPQLHLRTAEVRERAQKGRHTTSNVELHPLDFGGYVVDTPGIRELGLWDIWRDEMHLFFPEINPYVVSCRFSNCSHVDEQGCAVRKAVAQGKIAKTRYDSYLKLRSAILKDSSQAAGKFSDRRARRSG
jgi:ribosome biogenesis GTPase